MSYNSEQLKGSGSLNEDISGAKTFNFINSSSGSSYFSFEMLKDQNGFYPLIRTFNLTNPNPQLISAGENYLNIGPITGISTYVTGSLIQLKLKLYHTRSTDLDIYLADPTGVIETDFCYLLASGVTTGSNFVDTTFYNSVISTKPNISTGVAPYNGVWNDTLQGFSFDEKYRDRNPNGTWQIAVINNGLHTGSIISAELMFNSIPKMSNVAFTSINNISGIITSSFGFSFILGPGSSSIKITPSSSLSTGVGYFKGTGQITLNIT